MSEEHVYTVYLHICPKGKMYYGATKDINRRWKIDGKGYKKQPIFWKSINKYGWDNFQHIIVAKDLTEDEAYWLEIELIKVWDTTNPDKGYNIGKGGKGSNGLKHHTEDTKKKQSDANSGKNHPQAKSVICLTTKRIFLTVSDGAKYYNRDQSNITRCCQGKIKTSGRLNGQKLVWRYLVWNHNKTYRIKKQGVDML